MPSQGLRFSFSKLYANRASEPAEFSLPYSSRGGAWFARFVALLGAALFSVGLWRSQSTRRRRVMLASAATGALLVLVANGFFGVSLVWPILGSLSLPFALGLRCVLSNRPRPAAA